MHSRLSACAATAGLLVLAVCVKPAHPGGRNANGRKAIEKGLAFLEADAAKWRKERECSTCHHGTMTVWVLTEAQSRGFAVAADTLAETVRWTKGRLLDRIDNPRDTRPGWNMVSTPAIYLAVMAQVVPGQEAVTPEELDRISGHLLRHQESDGSWAWSLAPAQNRPPPFFESDEVATLMACMALGPRVPAGAKQSEARAGREKAAAWLEKTAPGDDTQAAALRLLRKVRAREPAKALRAETGRLLARQNGDGGWSQLRGLPSDAYATGQALYLLGLSGVKHDRAEIRRGAAFLVASQREDGSWPMTPRAHPGARPAANAVPITYFGSAWATLGLLRSVPESQ
jgi:hypothetical protein